MTGKKWLDITLISLNSIVGVILVSIFLMSTVFNFRDIPNEEESYKEFLSSLEQKNAVETYKFQRIIVNLLNPTQRLRYLDFVPELEPIDSKYTDMIKNKEPFIYDVFITISSKLDPEDLSSISGKVAFEERLKKEINKLFEFPVVKKIYFPKFIVQ